MQLKTSVVIPNWQGKDLLEKNLPHVLAIGADEVIVIENGSTDGSLELLKSKFPNVKVIVNKTNEGFAKAVNKGVLEAKGEIIFLLNTDVIPDKNIIKNIFPHFKNPEIFAVSFNEGKWSWARGFLKNGLIEHSPGVKTNSSHISFWASGGSAAFDRKKWIALRGFNLIYEPFYWEDLDLSYRAQKMGWSVIWEPRATVQHKHEETVNKHSMGAKKHQISQRNQLLFFWSNISSLSMWVQHLLWLPIRLIHQSYWIPFIWAIIKLPEVITFRLKQRVSIISDEEILNKFKN